MPARRFAQALAGAIGYFQQSRGGMERDGEMLFKMDVKLGKLTYVGKHF